MEISAIIAINLKRIREERKLSMGQLAEMAGVSKVVLSQLEKGTANPTINTIWKITGALGLPYSSLLEMPETNAIHIKKKDLQDMCDDGYHIFTYYGKEPARPFELYEIVVDPGAEHDSIGHSSESSEYIIRTEGSSRSASTATPTPLILMTAFASRPRCRTPTVTGRRQGQKPC